MDIRDIVQSEVEKYRQRLVSCVTLYLPIALLVWVVPYVQSLSPMMGQFILIRGISAYVLLIFVMSTYI